MEKKEKQIKNPRIIAAIKTLRNRKGLVMPNDVVEAARPSNSPLHPYFDWNDGKAAHEWRLQQARYLIRQCVEVTELIKDKPQEIHVFVSLLSERTNKGGYRFVVDVLSDKEQREEMLQMALDELTKIRNRYAELRELASLFEAIDRTVAKRRKK